MIRNFRHAGLKRFYERGDRRRLLAEHVPKIARVLAQLDIAEDANDMDLPGFHLHGRSTVKRGHEHHRSIRRCSAREGRPSCFGGAQRGGGT